MRSYITVCALAFAASVSAAPLGEAPTKESSSKGAEEHKAGGAPAFGGDEQILSELLLNDNNAKVLNNFLNNLLAGNNVDLNVLGIQKGNEQTTHVINSDSGNQKLVDRRGLPVVGDMFGKFMGEGEEKDEEKFGGEDKDIEYVEEEEEFHGKPEVEHEQEQEHEYTSSGYGSSNHGGKPYDTIIVKPTPSGGAGNGAQDPSHGAHGAGYGSQSAEAMSHGGQGAGFGGQGAGQGQGAGFGGQDPSAHAAQQGGAGQGFGQGRPSYGQQQGGAQGAGSHGGKPVGTESFDSSKGGY